MHPFFCSRYVVSFALVKHSIEKEKKKNKKGATLEGGIEVAVSAMLSLWNKKGAWLMSSQYGVQGRTARQ